ncbi:MAG TPA: squalene/phytoene synthase family protein [Anaerolineales bacterium]|nr:squalene/phytoene synthase family protein [Anaerolineales bacterium]
MRNLARDTTRAASAHTYQVIEWLVDWRRRDHAYLAYAYFRWVDDWLDGPARRPAARQSFVERQNGLIADCYAGQPTAPVSPQEDMLIQLIHSDPDPASPLAPYIHNMMAVMAFDAERRGRLILQAELGAYQRWLAVAVTEAIFYFLGADNSAAQTSERYLAVTAAHITHMLRDTRDDLSAGYYNIPLEYLRQHQISHEDVDSPPYRHWVRLRVHQARDHFMRGRKYLASCRSLSCRLATLSYTARFETVLDQIEADDFQLRRDYDVCRTPGLSLRIAASALKSAMGFDPSARPIEPRGSQGAPRLE